MLSCYLYHLQWDFIFHSIFNLICFSFFYFLLNISLIVIGLPPLVIKCCISANDKFKYWQSVTITYKVYKLETVAYSILFNLF